jgi:phosphate transport system protein
VHRHFDDELHLLKERVLDMGSRAEKALHKAVDALVRHDGSTIPQVFEIEKDVNDLEVGIEQDVLSLIARRQPVAQDLRFAIMAIKIAGEVERVCDQAVNIAQSTARLVAEPPIKRPGITPLMGEKAMKMLRESLDAFVRGDASLARRVLEADDEVDSLRDDVFRTMITYMMEDPTTISRGISLILIARNLERVADHATNIAEEVIFMVEAREVRSEQEKRARLAVGSPRGGAPRGGAGGSPPEERKTP